jgi:hypothetical protein
VPQPPERLDLAPKTGQAVARDPLAQHLEREQPPRRRLLGQVDDPHAATAELAQDAEAGDRLRERRGSGRELRTQVDRPRQEGVVGGEAVQEPAKLMSEPLIGRLDVSQPRGTVLGRELPDLEEQLPQPRVAFDLSVRPPGGSVTRRV